MMVTIRDTNQRDRVVEKFPILPGVGIPAIGHRLFIKERAHHGGGKKAVVTEVLWSIATKEASETEVALIVEFY